MENKDRYQLEYLLKVWFDENTNKDDFDNGPGLIIKNKLKELNLWKGKPRGSMSGLTAINVVKVDN